MENIFQKNGRSCAAGTELLRWRISLPQCESKEGNIAAFYEEIGRRAVKYCEERLSALARSEFDALDDPDKRFSFSAFSYRLEGRVTYEDEQFWSLCLVAELRRRGDRLPIAHFEDGQVWEKQSELRVPPEELVRRLGAEALGSRERKHARGVLLSRDAVLWYDGESWHKKEISKEFARILAE